MKSSIKYLAEVRQQVAGFERVREAHQSETAEDYVELIADLIETKGEARIVDLAERFGVSNATVNKVVARLKREGLVNSEPYRALFLTPEGREMATACKKRHLIVLEFLLAIGVSRRTAEVDAEGVEHHVSEETLRAFQRFIKKKVKG
ncbi:MAG: manganese-binding transcriptional regulator MntR [Alphaproteobacteria bacterium]